MRCLLILVTSIFVIVAVSFKVSNQQQEDVDFLFMDDLKSSSLGGAGQYSSFNLANKESLGFFKDVPEFSWLLYKKRFQATQPNYDRSNEKKFERWSRNSNYFWASQFEPEFTCPHEMRLGKLGDGGKWVCDPHRIEKDSCLVYSVGCNGNYMFEAEVFKHVSEKCQVHTFDITGYGRQVDFADAAKKLNPSYLHFHKWGLGDAKQNAKVVMKPFKDIIKDLNHENQVIDIMKIDCERCEYAQFESWLKDWKDTGVTVRQVQLEIHGSDLPGVVDLFIAFQKAGYVMFHKEANYINQSKAIEAAFVLLSNDFQQ